jgi:hypothetical protein
MLHKSKVSRLTRQEGVWGIRDIAPLIIDLGTDEGEWLTSLPGRFTAGKKPHYPLNKRIGGPSEPICVFWRRETSLTPYRDYRCYPIRVVIIMVLS